MTTRTSSVIAAAVLGVLTVACGSPSSAATSGTDSSGSVPVSTLGPIAPPPAEVLDATVVYFDDDGSDQDPQSPQPLVIADARALDAFARRYVDGVPALGSAARDALDDGMVLIGGTVSTGCFPAEGAQLVFTAADIRLVPRGSPPDDPDIQCVRAITSVALVAIDPTELPERLPLRGS